MSQPRNRQIPAALFLFSVFVAIAAAVLNAQDAKLPSTPASGLRSFEIVPLETVSETSSNASIGDLNGDGHPDIVLVKGRHWQVTTRIFYGDGAGHFIPGPPLPSNAVKSYSGSLADMTKSGYLDIVLSNDQPDPKLVLVNDGKGNFRVGGTYGESQVAHAQRHGRGPERRWLPGHRGCEPDVHELRLFERRQTPLRLSRAPEFAQRRLSGDCGPSRRRRQRYHLSLPRFLSEPGLYQRRQG